jgi:cytochrome P450
MGSRIGTIDGPRSKIASLAASAKGDKVATSKMNEDPEQILGNIPLLIVGDNDTTRNSISGGVMALNEYPDEYQKLRDFISTAQDLPHFGVDQV